MPMYTAVVGEAAVGAHRFWVAEVGEGHRILVGVEDFQIEIVTRGEGQFRGQAFVGVEGHPKEVKVVRARNQFTGSRCGAAEDEVWNAGWCGQVVRKVARGHAHVALVWPDGSQFYSTFSNFNITGHA